MQKNYCVGKYELDNNQMELLLNDTNSLVIAGAGSGKTLTILGKINYLIDIKKCSSKDILVISFTNASVNDLKSRINYNIDIFTFHKLAINIFNNLQYSYKLCPTYLLEYVIHENIKKCDLNDQKIILKFLKINTSYTKFLNSPKFNLFCNFVLTFINLYKTNNLNKKDIFNSNFSNLEKKILIIIFNIYSQYILEKKSMQILDFDDLIIYATELVEFSKIGYKYIIIDEFQDTSLIRLNLIKKIYDYTHAKIIVVGDDWQSIYRFSGCDLNIFLNFTNIFSNVKKIHLKNTYRNSLELISIASEFIQKNPLQIKKNLYSLKNNKTPFIFVPYNDKKLQFEKVIESLITKTNNIMILGRNNFDIYDYINPKFSYENDILYYKNLEIPYYTIHKSKGLEAEYVVILNCNNDTLGIPNKIENNVIIKKLFPNAEIKYAEERRLFYVAITRCKESAYLLYDKSKPSYFIKELKKIIKKQMHKIVYFK